MPNAIDTRVLGRGLRDLYDNIFWQPLPDRHLRLVRLLDEAAHARTLARARNSSEQTTDAGGRQLAA